MNGRPPTHGFLVALAAAAAFLYGCAVPLGPGFQHATRQVTIAELSPGQSGSQSRFLLHIRVTDEMENIGNKDLKYLDASFPSEDVFGMTNLHVLANGLEMNAAPVTHDSAAPLRIRFASSWAPNQGRSIVFDYDLDPPIAVRGRIAVSPAGFYISDPYAFPEWLPPFGVFVKANARATNEILELKLPDDFRVLGAGRRVSLVSRGPAMLHRFRVLPGDLPPYLIAGRYREQTVSSGGRSIVFWTMNPVDDRDAQTASERLAATAATFTKLFGPAAPATPKKRSAPPALWTIHIVEAPVAVTSAGGMSSSDDDATLLAASFPQGVLLDPVAVARGIATEPILQAAESELARTWFGWRVKFSSDRPSLLGDGIGLFGVVAAAADREGENERRQKVIRLIASYDQEKTRSAVTKAKSSPQPAIHKAGEEREVQEDKAALFLVALEDRVGPQKFAEALQRISRDMIGMVVNDADLRSALETATKDNLAEIFRSWAESSDVPAEFRSRYR